MLEQLISSMVVRSFIKSLGWKESSLSSIVLLIPVRMLDHTRFHVGFISRLISQIKNLRLIQRPAEDNRSDSSLFLTNDFYALPLEA